MDGTKSTADTTMLFLMKRSRREVPCRSRSSSLRKGGSCKDKNPASSNSKAR